ncbi:MAG: nucleotidyltransferase domain-containing protein [Candidatus Thermoplasmatota archaeon]|nr:nucleotidyltransferase domain-containing protein [Candidatus Thermoplasmatota archaeon]MCL5889303.1 nucleotidyltransferase domain-containing protein [Candidatus Thermoplasmatota archaeon]
MVKYKQSLLDVETHDLINRGKKVLLEKYGKPFSIAETIRYYMQGAVTFDRLPKSVISYLTEFVTLMSVDNRVMGLILFGSYSRGSQTKSSDIDVFMVFNGKKIDAFDLLLSVNDLLEMHRNAMSLAGIYSEVYPLITTLSDMGLLKPVYFDIMRDGIVLFQRNSSVDNLYGWLMKAKVKRFIVDLNEVISWTP